MIFHVFCASFWTKMQHINVKLAPSWLKLAPDWRKFVSSWPQVAASSPQVGQVGAKLAQVGAKLAQIGKLAGASWCKFGPDGEKRKEF